MKISICTYKNYTFEVILKDEYGGEVTLTGHQKLSEEEFALVTKLAPACVFTEYVLKPHEEGKPYHGMFPSTKS